MATKVVKAKVKKAKIRKESKPPERPWEVWGICDGRYTYDEAFGNEANAEEYINDGHSQYLCSVIVHIDIPMVKYPS